MRPKPLFSILFTLICTALRAEVTFHPSFGSHMVLQQKTTVALHGSATPGHRVVVRCSWEQNDRTVVTANDGSWSVPVVTPEASFEPQWIEVCEKNRIRLDDILIGEVWLCSGQSNMEMPMRGFPSQPVDGAAAEIATSMKYKGLRLFTVGRSCAETPQNECKGEWSRSTPDQVALFSAVAYLFGRRLTETLDVPVGLIVSSYGGSRIESWMDAESMAKFDPKDYIAKADKPYRDPCKLYNGMIAPLTGIPVRGVVWLQGESNHRNAHIYTSMLRELMGLWRRKWSQPEMPFIVCQIAPTVFHGESILGRVRIMEAQLRAVQEENRAWMVGTSDIGDEHVVHYPKKDKVAERVFYSALVNVYGMGGLPASGPTVARVDYTDGRAVVHFAHAERGLNPLKTEIVGFELAGADGVYHPAAARIGTDRATVEVSSDAVPAPCALRYAFTDWHRINLYNHAGLPAFPYRSDSVEYGPNLQK